MPSNPTPPLCDQNRQLQTHSTKPKYLPVMRHIVVKVLGTPTVIVDRAAAPLGSRQLLLVLRLLLARSSAVSGSRLRDDGWWDGEATNGALRVQIARLRAALGTDAIGHVRDGYQISSGVELDAHRFQALCVAARDHGSTIEARIATFDEALEMWSADAYQGLDHVPWLCSEAIHLNEVRQQAIDDRLVLRSLVVDPSELLRELRVSLANEPTNERRAVLLATSLYRAGRQTEALDVCRRLREGLRDRFGLSPTTEVAELEMRILRHDPTLMVTPTVGPSRHDGVLEGRLRSAKSLMRAGVTDEAATVLDGVADAALAANDRRSYAESLLLRFELAATVGSATADDERLIDEAQAIARQLRDGVLLARCAGERFRLGMPTSMRSVLVELTEPIGLLPTASPIRLNLLCQAALAISFVSASPSSGRLVEAARRTAELIGTPRADAVWLSSRAIVASAAGDDPTEFEPWATRALDIARELPDAQIGVVAVSALLDARLAVGDLRAVDVLLAELDRDSAELGLVVGTARATFGRTMNALARGEFDKVPPTPGSEVPDVRVRSSLVAFLAHTLLLFLETGRTNEIVDHVRSALDPDDPGPIDALLAVCGDLHADDIFERVEAVRPGPGRLVFAALASEVAVRDGHGPLGRWCAELLDERGAMTVSAGMGTLVVGFATHFAGLAHLAQGDADAARIRLETAYQAAVDAGAHVWVGR